MLVPAAGAADQEQETEEKGLRLARFDLLDGPGGYAVNPESVFYPGETLWTAFRIDGYEVNDRYRVKLTYRIEARGPKGVPFAAPDGGEFDAELAPEDEEWQPAVQYSAALPGHAPSGVYTIAVEVTDELAEQTIRRELPVRVEGERVELSEELTVRNLAFAHAERGTPLPDPVYEPGDTIWASFYITGYETRDDNTYSVASELRVIGPEGETLFSFRPQGETGSPFYPRLWLPATFRLDLDDDIPSGEYAVLLEVIDKVGGATAQIRRTFRIR